MMQFDETELIEFFGTSPVETDSEEEEFFGTAEFEVTRGDKTLRISFSATHAPRVIADLSTAGSSDPCLHVEIEEAAAVRVSDDRTSLAVMVKVHGEEGADASQAARLVLSLEPLRLSVRA